MFREAAQNVRILMHQHRAAPDPCVGSDTFIDVLRPLDPTRSADGRRDARHLSKMPVQFACRSKCLSASCRFSNGTLIWLKMDASMPPDSAAHTVECSAAASMPQARLGRDQPTTRRDAPMIWASMKRRFLN